MSIYDFNVRTIDGQEISMGTFKDKVLLIVNTASNCGFTPQYAGLEALYKKYAEQGLVVLGFPCNQFNQQEPGDSEEIKNFCRLTYDVTFPLFEKIDVNGEHAHPLYVYLKKEQDGVLGSQIKWNFTKFLVDRAGNVIKRYAPTTKPEEIENDIIAEL